MNESAKTPFDAESPMWQLWWDFLSKTTGAGMSFPPGSAPPETLRSARSEMFRVWADGWQEYLPLAGIPEPRWPSRWRSA